jgi:hypothetical protein
MVGTASGFGLYWACLDAMSMQYGTCALDGSAYSGLSFTISAQSALPNSQVFLYILTASMAQVPLDPRFGCGTCQGTCPVTRLTIPVSTTPMTVIAKWSDFGISDATAIDQISWSLPLPTNGSYPLDLTIDDIAFVAK